MKKAINENFAFAKSFVDGIESNFATSGTEVYRGRNLVKTFGVQGTELVVKRYKRPNLVQRVAYTFFEKGKAERAYLFASMLLDRGFDTPVGVAFVETRRHGLMLDSYFVSTSCTLPPLSSLLRRPDFDRRAAKDLAEYVVRLHEKGVLHGDLNLTNILYDESPSGHYSFVLIDTNRSRFCQPTRHDCLANLMRLSHDRPLLSFIARSYAAKRGWDEEATVTEVVRLLDRFEHRRAVIGKIKKAFKGKS